VPVAAFDFLCERRNGIEPQESLPTPIARAAGLSFIGKVNRRIPSNA
jgi:hypothetical protein